MADGIVRSFENIDLYQHDIDMVKRNEWVNDMTIHLHGALIQKKLNKGIKEGKNNILFIPPSTAIFMSFYPDAIVLPCLSDWNVFNAKLVFIPVNNSEAICDEGSHWSLLMWNPGESKNDISEFYHFDSMLGGNRGAAVALSNRLATLYEIRKHNFHSPTTSQQHNCVDCGVFTMANMEYLATHNGDFSELTKTVNQSYVTEFRKQLIDFLLSFDP